MSSTNLPTLLRTLSFLRLNQLAFQLIYRLRAALPGQWRWPRIPPQELIEASALSIRSPFLQRPFIRRADVENNRFVFLNQPVAFDHAIDWSAPEQSRLWRYNLHYFDFLIPNRLLRPEDGYQLMADWIAANPAGTPDAWDPYPTSLRIVNWVKFTSANSREKSTVPGKVLESLFHQVLYLERSIEYHLLANHLFKNIKALLFAGLFFDGQDAQRWRCLGCRLLEEQINEQVLADGGHFERSPMYHAMVLEDVLDLLNIFPEAETVPHSLRSKLSDAAARMINFLTAMTHPDGDIALFNDAALGIEHTTTDLTAYYTALTGRDAPAPIRGSLKAFPDSGYFIMAPSEEHKLIIDCGAIGPDFQPGHAHCDTLSFELSLRGRRVIVDSGCCRYEDRPIRQYNRGNAGHNSVTIDGQNQSEVWAAHRCARRAYPTLEAFQEDPDGALLFIGSHDGYRRLPGRPVHQRTIRWQGNLIRIDDRIKGTGRHHLVSTLHIHPDMELDNRNGGVVVSHADRPLARIQARGREIVEIQTGWYCPEFSRQIACPKLTLSVEATLPEKLGWEIHLL